MIKHLTIVFLLTIFVAHTSKACDCRKAKSASEAVALSDMVISGKVIKASYRHQLSQTSHYLDSLSRQIKKKLFGPAIVNEYTILVSNYYKGTSTTDTIVVRTSLDPVTDCGLILKENQDYIFYLYDISPGNLYFDYTYTQTYYSSVCTRTRVFDETEEKQILKAIRRNKRVKTRE